MQSKGAIRFVAILIAIACLYQLSFTVVSNKQTKNAEQYAVNAVQVEKTLPSFANISEEDQAFYLDSLKKAKAKYFSDSIFSEKVYLGYTDKEVKEKELNLGLDLKGGMNVVLQVELSDLVKALADYNTSPEFNEALVAAKKDEVNSHQDFITLFQAEWNKSASNQKLSTIFGTYEMRDRIKPESTDDEVMAVIRNEAESAIANSFNVLRNRIDRFGVTSPNIQRLGSSGRILVELPGVKEPDRVRKLLQGTASLEFWTTYEAQDIYASLQDANSVLREYYTFKETADSTVADKKDKSDNTITSEKDSTAVSEKDSTADNLLNAVEAPSDSLSKDQIAFAKQNPLFAILHPMMNGNQLMAGPVLGVAHYRDTAKINKMLALPQVKALLNSDLRPMWTVHPSEQYKGDSYYELVAIKTNGRDEKAPLDGSVVTDARKQLNGTGGAPEVSMTMNAEGARVWARLTSDNIGKCVAIVLDDMVYSFPRVNSAITGGSSSITGNFTLEEAEDLANVLKSGKLPAPATIVQESVVGPSLGSESIHAGMISFILAFVLILIYMGFFYQGAGLVADIALLCNVLFLFGTLTSFGAVLTLPGIAGLVLTLGMAVDANVIIYERIKEELRAGKSLKLAIHDGYKNAYSAIIDGQITTILTGIVLFIFGSGPIQGFATVLIIGIITSITTSIFVTRLIFDDRLNAKRNITFDSKIIRNFLQNTKIDFVGMRKYTYSISLAVIVISIGFMAIKGFTYGVDFTGGRTYVVRFDQTVSTNDVRAALLKEFDQSVEVKQFGGDSQMKITTKYLIDDNSTETDAIVDGKLYNALKTFYSDNMTLQDFKSSQEVQTGIISSDKVGPTIANDIKRDAMIAVLVALLVIFGYIAMRFNNWSWGLGGVTALVHDTIITVGFFSIFTGVLPFTLDIDQTFIAAILTIIGYSINDTVVIFDRIRENNYLVPKRDLKININEALNSTLSRTFNTSASTLIVMLAIAIFGGEVIRGMAVALCIGIIVGTYSSVCIATPVMYDMHMKYLKKLAAKVPGANKK